ncbi:MAG: hypothetical protein C4527_17310 [Candidatus Omnitrophota bacterium]|nr:MAG: hypothetical protein C4527_17310 [Candidatus Omnitrophota bacterium]
MIRKLSNIRIGSFHVFPFSCIIFSILYQRLGFKQEPFVLVKITFFAKDGFIVWQRKNGEPIFPLSAWNNFIVLNALFGL